jgi:hypothetical protein
VRDVTKGGRAVHWDMYEMSIGDAGQCIGMCMRCQ